MNQRYKLWKWVCEPTATTCKQCSKRNGQIFDEVELELIELPPLHQNCRCQLVKLDENNRVSANEMPLEYELPPAPQPAPPPVNEFRSDVHAEIIELCKQYHPREGTSEWSSVKVTQWVLKGAEYSDIKPFKDQWIIGYSHIIKAAAEKYDIPPILLAGVLHIEVGGDPFWVDSWAYYLRRNELLRELAQNGYLPSILKPHYDLTSFGYASMQVKTAAKTLGYDYDTMDAVSKVEIIMSLEDPVQSVFMAALHLSQLRDLDYPLTAGNELTDDQIAIIASRYNRGTSESADEIVKDYGSRILEMKSDLERLLRSLPGLKRRT